MNGLSNKEKHLREILLSQTYQIDSNQVWDSILDQLPPEKNKRRFLFLPWLGIGCLMFLLVGAFSFKYFQDMNITSLANDQAVSDFSNTLHEKTSIKDLKSIDAKKENSSDEKYLSKESNIFNSEKQVSNSNSKLKPTTQKIDNKAKQIIERNNISTTNLFESKTKQTSSTNTFEPMAQNSNTNNALDVDSSKMTIEASKANNVTSTDRVDRTAIENFTMLASLDVGKFDYQNGFHPSNDPIKPQRKNKWVPFVSVRTGANNNFSKFSEGSPFINTSETNKFYNEFSELELTKESDLVGAYSDISFGVESSKGWEFFAGFGYAQQVAVFRNNDISTSNQSRPGNEEEHFDEQGGVQFFAGQRNQEVITNNDVRWHRKHTSITLNVGASREVVSIKRFSLSPELSLNYGVHTQNTGYFFDNDQANFTKFTEEDQSPYKTNGIISSTTALNFEYHVGSFALSLVPGFRYQLNNSIESNHFYKLKNSFYGVQMGVTYRFY